MSIVSMRPSNRLILYHSLLLLLSIFPSIMVFSNESALCIRWPDAPKYWSFSVSISPSNEYSGLIFFRTDHLIFLPPKGLSRVFSSIHSSKASILQCSVFFMILLSHLYLTTRKTIGPIWTFAGKVMSLLFNTLSRFVIVYLPRRKSLLVPWLQSPSAVILEPKNII